ncbi:hypothetical protein KKD60_04190 [Patescibacteria group bacterium]|nr:hypothetical protein [Patescibacteria group bacterium]
MQLKLIISKNNIVNLINPIIYAINIIVIIIVIIFINKNVYQTIAIQGQDLRDRINESPNDINIEEFNKVVDKINYRKTKQQSITIGEIF